MNDRPRDPTNPFAPLDNAGWMSMDERKTASGRIASLEEERDRLREALEHIRHHAVRLGAAWAEDRARAALKGGTL